MQCRREIAIFLGLVVVVSWTSGSSALRYIPPFHQHEVFGMVDNKTEMRLRYNNGPEPFIRLLYGSLVTDTKYLFNEDGKTTHYDRRESNQDVDHWLRSPSILQRFQYYCHMVQILITVISLFFFLINVLLYLIKICRTIYRMLCH